MVSTVSYSNINPYYGIIIISFDNFNIVNINWFIVFDDVNKIILINYLYHKIKCNLISKLEETKII